MTLYKKFKYNKTKTVLLKKKQISRIKQDNTKNLKIFQMELYKFFEQILKAA